MTYMCGLNSIAIYEIFMGFRVIYIYSIIVVIQPRMLKWVIFSWFWYTPKQKLWTIFLIFLTFGPSILQEVPCIYGTSDDRKNHKGSTSLCWDIVIINYSQMNTIFSPSVDLWDFIKTWFSQMLETYKSNISKTFEVKFLGIDYY